MEIGTVLVLLLGLVLGAALGGVAAGAWGYLRGSAAARAEVAPWADEHGAVREGLAQLHDHLNDLQRTDATWQGQLHQQVHDVVHHTDLLRRETSQLVTALRRPQVRGRWGELHLRRAVELAGMVAHCDFTEQLHLDDGARRPDLVVRLAGGRCVVVDAKVPLEAYLDACTGSDDTAPADPDALRRHAAQVRSHIDLLGSKNYWRSLPETPEFVVLFLPAESFLGAALEADATLLEHGATRHVVLATPSTLIALLRTVEHGWRHESLSKNAAQIAALGTELHGRLLTFRGHLDKVGAALNSAAGGYNAAVSSLESRVLVTARRLSEQHHDDEPLEAPRPVTLHAVETSRRGSDTSPGESRTVAQ